MDSQYSSLVIYLQCSKRFLSTGTFRWGNPCDVGTRFVDENNETICAGSTIGRNFFTDVEEMRSRQFIKGGSAVFVFSFHGEQIEMFLLQNLTATSSQIYLHQSGRFNVEQSQNVPLFLDLTPLLNGSALPCPKVGPVEIRHPQRDVNKGPCSPR